MQQKIVIHVFSELRRRKIVSCIQADPDSAPYRERKGKEGRAGRGGEGKGHPIFPNRSPPMPTAVAKDGIKKSAYCIEKITQLRTPSQNSLLRHWVQPVCQTIPGIEIAHLLFSEFFKKIYWQSDIALMNFSFVFARNYDLNAKKVVYSFVFLYLLHGKYFFRIMEAHLCIRIQSNNCKTE